jgi:hypothetical protein
MGILGLGFTSLSSIDYEVNRTGADWGRSVLYNAFAANPTEPNYITFALQRSTDEEDEVEGTFTIGMYQKVYAISVYVWGYDGCRMMANIISFHRRATSVVHRNRERKPHLNVARVSPEALECPTRLVHRRF